MGASSVPNKPQGQEVPVRMLLLFDLEGGNHWGAYCTTSSSFACTITLGLAHGALLLLGSESHLSLLQPLTRSAVVCSRSWPAWEMVKVE
jgi:hypothetical protein